MNVITVHSKEREQVIEVTEAVVAIAASLGDGRVYAKFSYTILSERLLIV